MLQHAAGGMEENGRASGCHSIGHVALEDRRLVEYSTPTGSVAPSSGLRSLDMAAHTVSPIFTIRLR